MRRILRKIAEDEPGSLGDTSTLADPAVVDDWSRIARTRKTSRLSCSRPSPVSFPGCCAARRCCGVVRLLIRVHLAKHSHRATVGPGLCGARPKRHCTASGTGGPVTAGRTHVVVSSKSALTVLSRRVLFPSHLLCLQHFLLARIGVGCAGLRKPFG